MFNSKIYVYISWSPTNFQAMVEALVTEQKQNIKVPHDSQIQMKKRKKISKNIMTDICQGDPQRFPPLHNPYPLSVRETWDLLLTSRLWQT